MLADITRERADAIVTPASREPRIGTGVDSAIHAAAGKELLDARIKLGSIGPGIVHATPAFKLVKTTKAKYVIHCLGPVYDPKLRDNSEFVLAYTYLLVLLKAKSLGCRTVSIPLLSSGNFKMPLKKATDIAVEAIATYLEADKGMTVNLVSINPEFHEYAKEHYGKMYDVSKKWYGGVPSSRGHRPNAGNLTLNENQDYFKNVVLNHIENLFFSDALHLIWEYYKTENASPAKTRRVSVGTMHPEFKTYQDLADATGISFSTLRKYMVRNESKSPKPHKDKLIAILAELRVKADLAEVMLKKCGYSFKSGSSRDSIIREFLEKKDGGVAGLNFELQRNHEKCLATARRRKKSRAR